MLRIELDNDDFIVFKDLIIVHSGMLLPSKFKENALNAPKYNMEPGYKAVREFEINPKMDCICYVQSGGVIFRNCTLTLKSHRKKLKSRIPIIVSFPKTLVNLTSCTMQGHEDNHNAACIFLNSDVSISDTKFSDFRAGGIYCVANPDNSVTI